MIQIDTSQFDWFPELMQRRLPVVAEIETEGAQHAEAYAAAGGRHREPGTRRYHYTQRRLLRRHRATGNQRVRMMERIAYQKLVDWWGSW
jgi:hypothetical protein